MLKNEGNKSCSCIVPQPKYDLVGDRRWESMHQRYVAEAKSSESEILFIGDSIIQHLQFTTLWNDKINSLHCLNFGIGGDRVEHILWRVLDGELDFAVPLKAVVLFVGTNNTDCTAQAISDGICEIIKVIRVKLGDDVHIILPTLLPRGQYPNPNRDRNDSVNRMLIEKFEGTCSADKNIQVVPIHENIVQSDGTISHHVMYDYLHLTDQGYIDVFTPVYTALLDVVSLK